jgi:hypothetical protein
MKDFIASLVTTRYGEGYIAGAKKGKEEAKEDIVEKIEEYEEV